ncbi:MAG: SAM-dependent chlorinase/fluorinase [Alphaproteobacteria bacterium]|jgi:S-adenosylmethionine hydrolase|nr:SAM-dependent chlorinase/fluorinase [Alphaproteobacteria bacterium]
MKNFIKLIAVMFVLANINPLAAITVFDSPSSMQPMEPTPAPVPQKEPETVKEAPKKEPAKKTPAKVAPAKKAPIKKTPEKKEAPKAPSKAIAPAPQKKAAPTPATTQANVKSNLPPLIIVNNFEEDPIFIPAIRGTLFAINKNLEVIDISKNTESKSVISQAYKLLKASRYWGTNAVFISGSFKDTIEPSIIVAKSKNNQFFVTQNSGVLTFIEDTVGIAEVREIQRVNFDAKTPSGRDVEYLVGAKLINDPNSFNTMGEPITLEKLARFSYTALNSGSSAISALFVVEDKDNGDIFTFITSSAFAKFNPKEDDMFKIVLSNGANIIADFEAVYKNSLTYSGGNQAIILNYKSSIGSFVILKNVKVDALSTIDNAKITISRAVKTEAMIYNAPKPQVEEPAAPYIQSETIEHPIMEEAPVEESKPAQTYSLSKENVADREDNTPMEEEPFFEEAPAPANPYINSYPATKN